MNNNMTSQKFFLEPVDKERLARLWGPFDDNLKQIERRLGVQIVYKNELVTITGTDANSKTAKHILKNLYIETAPIRGKTPNDITPEMVHLAISECKFIESASEANVNNTLTDELNGIYSKAFNIKTKRGLIKPRSETQNSYIQNILSHDVSFGIGPAGTGKTYLAVAAAVDALERQEVRRILLTRPAVEAGEKLGFLPGDLTQKVDPYLRPLYDALFEMLGFEKVEKLIERQIIEIAPLAYMRGRTLNDSFIILDEGQNTTSEQMKMLLTRIGFNSKAVITGDITQIDLPKNVKSGLKVAIEVLSEVDEVSFDFFTSTDVVRHPIVAKIVQAYEGFEKEQEKERKRIRDEKFAKLNNSSNGEQANETNDENK